MHIKDNYMMITAEGYNPEEMSGFAEMAVRGKIVTILNSLYSYTCLSKACRLKILMQNSNPELVRTFAWMSIDPEGKQHSTGMIMRQGIDKALVKKGKRRGRAMFEGQFIHKFISETADNLDFGPIMEGTASVADIEKCMSKQVNYNQPEVETVSFENFKYLYTFCIIFLIVSFAVLFLENVDIITKQARVTPTHESLKGHL